MTKLKITTWNINSVRLRAPNVADFIAEEKPDVLCLQEIKCREAEFPMGAFRDAGLKHVVIEGQKGLHGVAIASRYPLERVLSPPLCRNEHARVIAAKVKGVEVHNIYLPAGGDIPDPVENDKFAHKLDFLERLGTEYTRLQGEDGAPRVLVGDLNVAPQEHDVWSHKQLLKIVSHTPEETSRLEDSRTSAGFHDIARLRHEPDQKLYTWWSYRAKDWAESNRGRRLDHIWANDAGMEQVEVDSYAIHLGWRGGFKPSDHAPVSVELKV